MSGQHLVCGFNKHRNARKSVRVFVLVDPTRVNNPSGKSEHPLGAGSDSRIFTKVLQIHTANARECSRYVYSFKLERIDKRSDQTSEKSRHTDSSVMDHTPRTTGIYHGGVEQTPAVIRLPALCTL